jgi:hypothetical protein
LKGSTHKAHYRHIELWVKRDICERKGKDLLLFIARLIPHGRERKGVLRGV